MSASAAASPSPPPLLRVRNLRTGFDVRGGTAWAVNGVSFDVRRDEILGIVGESGSGKSVTALSILRLIAMPPGRIAGGEIMHRGRNLLGLSNREIRRVRGKDIAMVFQEPMSSLNPVFTIGTQVMEPLIFHARLSRRDAAARAVEVLEQVGIPDAARRLGDYPHQFSGGMRQRVMIAMALVCEPELLIADEPTTALDVTIQAQILDLMRELQGRRAGASIVLITHDLAVIAETCDRVLVFYGGQVQEVATAERLFARPLHPYTVGLLESIPRPERKGQRLQTIAGNVPPLWGFPSGCSFRDRCLHAATRCAEEEPALRELEPGHWVRCHFAGDLPEARSGLPQAGARP